MHLCIYKCYFACTVILGSASGMFWHIQALFKEHIHAYSEVFVCLTYSKPWHIHNTKHIQTLRYIHNIIFSQKLNLGRFMPFWMLSNAIYLPFYRCYLTSRVTLRIFNVIFQTYSGIFKTYSATFSPVKGY